MAETTAPSTRKRPHAVGVVQRGGAVQFVAHPGAHEAAAVAEGRRAVPVPLPLPRQEVALV